MRVKHLRFISKVRKVSIYFVFRNELAVMGKRRSIVNSPRRSPSNRQSPIQHTQSLSKTVADYSSHPRKNSAPLMIPASSEGKKYAGPKFSSPPSADLLPKPPSKWLSTQKKSGIENAALQLDAMTVHLRQMLKLSTA